MVKILHVFGGPHEEAAHFRYCCARTDRNARFCGLYGRQGSAITATSTRLHADIQTVMARLNFKLFPFGTGIH
jgi:hypothetical protein